MAKSYYSLEETGRLLGLTETQIKGLVRSGKLREFRDAGKVNYRVDDVEKLSAASGARKPPPAAASSGSGELVLEPAEDSGIDLASTTGSQSGIDLASTGSDAISLAESDADATAVGDAKKKDKKDDTVITSVGVSVFEDDDADIMTADPVAETVVSDGGLGIEGVGSGSGLLDLTRKSDDTSLGAELLDEISGELGDGGDLGEATRAGLDGAVSGPAAAAAAVESVAEAAASRGVVVTRVEYGPDPVSMGLTGLMGAGVLIMCFLGLTVAAMMRGAVPALLEVLYEKSWIFGLASLAAAGIATGVGYFLGKKAEQS